MIPRQRENDVWSSVSFAYIYGCKYGVNFKASLILFYVSQSADAFKKVANFIN
jgi:hypothetical protein